MPKRFPSRWSMPRSRHSIKRRRRGGSEAMTSTPDARDGSMSPPWTDRSGPPGAGDRAGIALGVVLGAVVAAGATWGWTPRASPGLAHGARRGPFSDSDPRLECGPAGHPMAVPGPPGRGYFDGRAVVRGARSGPLLARSCSRRRCSVECLVWACAAGPTRRPDPSPAWPSASGRCCRPAMRPRSTRYSPAWPAAGWAGCTAARLQVQSPVLVGYLFPSHRRV